MQSSASVVAPKFATYVGAFKFLKRRELIPPRKCCEFRGTTLDAHQQLIDGTDDLVTMLPQRADRFAKILNSD